MKWEYSCGAVVFTDLPEGRRYVLVRAKKGHYGFPKGHMEAGETEEQTALREIREEVGLHPEIIPGFRTQMVYPLPRKKDTWKRVVLFVARYQNEPIVPLASEVLSAPLVSFDEAMGLFTGEDFRRVLREAADFLADNHI